MKHQTRETWLHDAIERLSKTIFKNHKLPQVKVSVGLPYGRGSKKAIGQHWHPDASDDKRGSIFISPTIANAETVLGVLVHELVHAIVGNEAGHGPKFRRVAIDVGLTGQMTATVASPELQANLKQMIKKIGKYPHSKLNVHRGPIKKQSTRLIKMECPDCGYKVRAARTAIISMGPVICPCNGEAMQIDLPEEK